MSKNERILKISQKINSFQVHNIGPKTEIANRQIDDLIHLMS